MRTLDLSAVALSVLLVAGLPSTARAQANGPVSTSASNFNGTPIPQGRYIWFTGVCKVTGVPASGAKVYLNNSTVTFSANSVDYTINVPNSVLTFAPSTTAASATFNTGTQTWEIALPTSGLSGNVLLGAVAYQVPVNFPGGIDPVTWTGTFATDTAGLTVKWQWGAAVYTTFSSTYSAVGIKTVDDNHDDANYQNSDHAGTPENFKTYVVGGARGGGGSNWTGSLSGTKTVSTFNGPPGDTTPPTIAPAVSPLITGFTTGTPTIQAALADPGTGASGVNPATFHATLDGSNVTSSFSVTASNASAALGPLTGGAHTLVFTVNDSAGNTGSATLTINVDATPPSLSLAPATGTFQGPTTAVTATYSDAGLGVSVATFHATLDGNDVTSSFTAGASSATASLGPLANGSHTLTVTIADLGGNVATTTATYQVDTVAPIVAAVVTPLSGGYTSGTPAVAVSYSDPSPGSGIAVASFHATLDGNDVTARFTPGASSASGSLGPLTSGAHTLVASIADNVGNVGQTTVTFNADLVGPTVTVDPANGTTASSNLPTITVSHSDPAPGSGVNPASVALELDGVSLTPTSQTASSTTFVPSAALPPGSHSLESRASDNVGNTTILTTSFSVPSAGASAFVLTIAPVGSPGTELEFAL